MFKRLDQLADVKEAVAEHFSKEQSKERGNCKSLLLNTFNHYRQRLFSMSPCSLNKDKLLTASEWCEIVCCCNCRLGSHMFKGTGNGLSWP